MNAFDSTVLKMETLPESDVIEIENYSKDLFLPLTGEEILNDLQVSHQQIEQGKCIEMEQAIEAIQNKYGL